MIKNVVEYRWRKREQLFLSDFDKPIWGYLTGVIVGDGWRTYNRADGSYEICICSVDLNYLSLLYRILENLNMNPFLYKDSIKFRNKTLFQILESPLNEIVLHRSIEWERRFVAGLYDAEGALINYHTVNKGKRYNYYNIEICTSYPSAIDVLSAILEKLGIHFRRYIHKRKGRVNFYQGKKIISKRDLPFIRILRQEDVEKFFRILKPLNIRKYPHGYRQYFTCPLCWKGES